MRRREFTIGTGAAILSPAVGSAQQAGKIPVIGVVGPQASLWSAYLAPFTERLRSLGWIEGRNVAIEYRWTEGLNERAAEIAAELARLKVDVIVSVGSAVAAMKRATSTIPIVFPIAIDPVAGGLVASLARPGGNVTGLSVQQSDLAGKRLQILHDVVPNLRRLAIMVDVGYPEAERERDEVVAAARVLGLDVASLEIRRAEDIVPAFAVPAARADALYGVVSSVVGANRPAIAALALAARLPTIFANRSFVDIGGLLSYGPSPLAMFSRAAEMVDKILRGTKPWDIPVEQPTKFELVVNLKTAKALGLNIPESFLVRADEVIE